jgi:hypothetical protein
MMNFYGNGLLVFVGFYQFNNKLQIQTVNKLMNNMNNIKYEIYNNVS